MRAVAENDRRASPRHQHPTPEQQVAPQGRNRTLAIIEALIEQRPGVTRTGFRAAVRKLIDDPRVSKAIGWIIPDAFEIHHDLRVISIIEVIDTHPINANKAHAIALIGRRLQRHGWSLSVVVYDNCGALIEELPSVAFLPTLTRLYRTERPRDILPAARAVYRELARPEVQP